MAQGVPGRLRPRIILTFRHYKGGRSSVIRTGRLYPRRNPWYSFSGAESTPGHMVLSEGTTEKIPSDSTGNRSRDRLSTQRLNHYATPIPAVFVQRTTTQLCLAVVSKTEALLPAVSLTETKFPGVKTNR